MQKFYKSLKNKAEATLVEDPNKIRYVGFNKRLLTNMIDTFVLFLLTLPLLFFVKMPDMNAVPKNAPQQVMDAYQMHAAGAMSEADFAKAVMPFMVAKIITYLFINIFFIGVVYVVFWKKYNSTPGKMLSKIKIVDAKTFQNPTAGQYIIRFFGYIISAIPFFFGFFLVGLNKRKRGLHDMLAGTAVIYSEPLNPEWEKKKFKYQSYFMLVVLIIGIIYISKVFN